jgi:hypothetical protein
MAKELGLPVSTDIPSDVLELMKLYPQPVRAQAPVVVWNISQYCAMERPSAGRRRRCDKAQRYPLERGLEEEVL